MKWQQRCRTTTVALTFVIAVAGPAAAQVHAPTADPADVASVDAIIEALYASISGPAGPRQWHRFHSLMLPGGTLMPAQPRPDSLPPPAPWSAREYQQRVAPYFMENPFYETELWRTEDRFGTVVHAMSAYESRRRPDAEPFQRGVNSIQLIRHAGRWWIASIVWDAERPGNPLAGPPGPGSRR